VGTFHANPWGLYDMHGNVWQWCSDWYGLNLYLNIDGFGDSIRVPAAKDPIGPAQGTAKIVRGGSWADTPRFLRSACRESTPPDQSRIHIGFRVVMEAGL